MYERIKRLLTVLTFIGVALSVISSCRLFDNRIEIENSAEWRYYSITPETIIELISLGKTDVFTIMTTPPEGNLSQEAAFVRWSQEDYFLIARTIHEQSLGEPLGELNLYNVLFKMDCSDVQRGMFSNAEFLSFKTIQISDEESRIEHWITIWPVENLVYTVEVKYQPNIHHKEPIDLSRYQIAAEDALQIAEENGGSKVRLKVGDACQIDAFAPGPDGKGWRIVYQDFPGFKNLLFEIAINPDTGEYKVLYPKP